MRNFSFALFIALSLAACKSEIVRGACPGYELTRHGSECREAETGKFAATKMCECQQE